MPSTMYNCRKCENTKFTTINDLRKHQWSEHRETFAKLIQAGQKHNKKKGKWSKEQRARYKATMALRAQHEVYVNGTPMSAAQLLDKLKMQRNFMNDVVSLVEGLIK